MGHERAVKVSKWGNSLAVRLPATLVAALGLKEGDELTIGSGGDGTLKIEKTPDRHELLERVRQLRGKFPADFKFDREEANERRRDDQD